MEGRKERDHRFGEHVYKTKDRCAKTKEMWIYPMRPYGFWTSERHNSQLAWDAQISQAAVRSPSRVRRSFSLRRKSINIDEKN
ncbi:hypothetical protein P8452_60323 [Trifolium repens]|nr:hypothetical protein P8452_60323 [Trifolium repens]